MAGRLIPIEEASSYQSSHVPYLTCIDIIGFYLDPPFFDIFLRFCSNFANSTSRWALGAGANIKVGGGFFALGLPPEAQGALH